MYLQEGMLTETSVASSIAEPVHFCAAPDPAPARQKIRLRLQPFFTSKNKF
jgi:hypothetical protein